MTSISDIIGDADLGLASALLPPTEETRKASDFTIEKLELVGMRRKIGGTAKRPKYDYLTQRIEQSLTDGSFEQTMEGASTLTLVVHDPGWAIMDSGLFDVDDNDELDVIDVKLDRLWFRLDEVNPQGDTLTLVFLDREVKLLMEEDKPLSASRADRTRAQFAELVVREVKPVRIKLFAPEKNKKQAIGKADEVDDDESDRGIHSQQDVKVNKKKIDAGQRRNITLALQIAGKKNASHRVKLALLEALIAESEIRNLTYGDSSSVGILQLLDIHYGGSVEQRRNVKRVITDFLGKGFTGAGGAIAIARKSPSISAAEIAARVQGNRDGSKTYAAFSSEAQAILKAWGDDAGSGSESVTRVKQYRFSRGANGEREDSWTCLLRLAEEVQWRCFMRNGTVWFISEPRLLKQKASAVISRTSPGVDTSTFGFSWHAGKRVQELSFDIRAERWAFPPGSVIVIQKSGTANGRWLVSTVSRPSLFDAQTTITLTKARKPKKEPAADTETTTTDTGDSSNGSADASATDKVYSKAVSISGRNYPYVWGGGHSKAGTPDGGTGRDPGTGFDCSGYTAACLDAGGMLPDGWKSGVPASGTFQTSYGQAGKGERVTVWANGSHVFIEFHIKGKKGNYADTSQSAGGSAGPHVRFGRRSTAGFTPRHWPGT